MITTLGLREIGPTPSIVGVTPEAPSLDTIERDFRRAISGMSKWMERARRTTIVMPTELLLHAATILLPAERMAVAALRTFADRRILGTLYDVTGDASRAHVRSDPGRLVAAMMTFERAGIEIGAWLHSHPGRGPHATHPSSIDRDEYAKWTRDFGTELIGIIVVDDGYVRLWGDSIESGALRVELVGGGVRRLEEHPHVYRLER